MSSRPQEKYFFFFLLAIVIAITFLIFRPFLIVIVLAVCFAVAISPLQKFFLKRFTKNKGFSAFLTTLIFVFLVVLPLFSIGFLVYKQSNTLFLNSGQHPINPVTDTISGFIENVLPDNIVLNTNEIAQKFVSSISKNLANIFTSTLSTILSIVLMFLSIFFFLKDGDVWKKFLIKLSPMSDDYDVVILKELRSTINGVVKGYLLIALVQGILMGVGLTIFGVNNAALWGLAGGIAGLVPAIGTTIVAVPIIIYLYVSGNIPSAVGFAIWSATIVGLVDNFLHLVVTAKKVSLPPLVILFSVLGGISFFGPAGIIVGPLCVSLLHSLLVLYKKHFRSKEKL